MALRKRQQFAGMALRPGILAQLEGQLGQLALASHAPFDIGGVRQALFEVAQGPLERVGSAAERRPQPGLPRQVLPEHIGPGRVVGLQAIGARQQLFGQPHFAGLGLAESQQHGAVLTADLARHTHQDGTLGLVVASGKPATSLAGLCWISQKM